MMRVKERTRMTRIIPYLDQKRGVAGNTSNDNVLDLRTASYLIQVKGIKSRDVIIEISVHQAQAMTFPFQVIHNGISYT